MRDLLGRVLCWLGWRTCQRCGKLRRDVVRYHQRTQYPEEGMNWVTLCPECRAENDAYWDERWDEYYRGCM